MDTLRLQVILDGIDRATKPLQGILKGTTALSKAAKETRDRLKDLNNQQKQLDAFRTTTANVTATAQALAAARDRVRDLAGAITAANTPAKTLTDEYKAATAELRKLTTAHQRAADAQRQATADMQRAGIPVDQLANRQRHLASEIATATARLEQQGHALQRTKALQTAYRNTMSARSQIATAGTGAGAVGAAGAYGVLKTLKAYTESEDAGTRLAASMMQVGGVVPAQYKQINDLATRLGDKLPGTTADYQNMMQMLIRQGMSAKAILGGLGEATAYLAVQLDMPKDAAAEFASKLQDATHTTEKDMLSLMDVIQRTYYLGVDSGNTLQGFAKLSPVLSILKKEGLDAAKALAPLLVMADQSGMPGETAGNAYRKIIQAGLDAKKMAKGNAELKGLGIGLDFTDSKGNFAGLDNLFAQLQKVKGLNDTKKTSVLKTIFGDDAETLEALTIIIDKGKAGYDEVVGKMQAQADLQTRVNAQLGTLKALWEATSGTFTNLLASLGESISPQVKAITQWLGDAAASIRQWAVENPRLSGTLMQITAVISVAAIAVGGLLIGLAALLGPLALIRLAIGIIGIPSFITTLGTLASSALPAVATALRVLAALAMAHPLLALITAIAAGATYIWANWDTLGPKFASWWNNLKSLFTNGVQFVLDKINAIKQFFGVSVDYKQLAPPIAAPAPLRAGAAAPTINTTNHINLPAVPGHTPQDVAKAVRTELDARDRQRAAQRRSIFADAN
jgi:TP901 family phage tail tape measure protein